MVNTLDFSVIIPATRDDLLAKCLQSLAEMNYPKNKFEVIVIQDKHVNGASKLNIHYVVLQENNPALRRNLGAERARAQYLAFIDDDVVVSNSWLKTAKKILDENECAGVGGPDMIPPGSSFREKLTDALLSHKYFGSGVLAHSYYPKRKVIGHGSAIALCNMIIRKKDFLKAGGFNVKIGYGGEDTELIHIMQRKYNAVFIYDPSLVVYHKKRPFGLHYFKQRFVFRIKNGKLIYAYPDIYLRKKAFVAFMIGMTGGVLTLLVNQYLFVIGAAIYLAALVITSLPFLKKDVRIFILLPMLLAVQHVIYYIGIVIGLLHFYKYKELRAMRRI